MIGNKFISELSKDKFQEELVTKTFPWILISSCPEPVYVYWFNAESFLKYTRDVNFTQSLRSNENTYLCEEKTADIAKCNVTGTWRTFDSDISNACGNIEGFRFPVLLDNALNISYRNKFYKICNPQFIPNAECDSHWLMAGTNNSDSCLSLPDMHVCSI